MKEYGVGNKYGLDLEALWSMMTNEPNVEGEIELSYGNTLTFEKSNGTCYYDLHDRKWEPVCMDGELCEILKENADYVELVEEDTQIRFKLSRREFEIAAMC